MGGRVRSHRSRRRPVRWRSGPTCAQVNGLFACKGVGGVGVGRSGPECRWRRGRRGRRAHPAASRAQVRMEGCGGEWLGVPVPRFFLCVGALHPIRRQCTSSVRVHRHVTGAPPRNGCNAPVLVAAVNCAPKLGRVWWWPLCGFSLGLIPVFCGGLLCLSCLPLGLCSGLGGLPSAGLGLSSAWGPVWCLCGPLWHLMLWFLKNVARNSPTCISNIEIASLELQRFGVLQKVRAPELRASFG